MDWRYWITYSGRVQADSEDSAYLAAADLHAERIHGGDSNYVSEIEVEPEGREGE